MAKLKSSRVRKDAQRIEVYNEGHFIFLYDEAREKELKEAEAAEVVIGEGEIENGEKRRKDLGKIGALVVYQLFQDDSEVLEISVGKPLTATEQKEIPWMKPQQAFLSLPSGKLRIESWNSLKISDEGGKEKGCMIDVPPGDYVLTLHRVDFWSEEEYPLSGLITLTPTSELKVKKGFSPLIELPDDTPKKKSSIHEDVFHGTIYSGNQEWVTDMTPEQIERLGWRHGERLRIETKGWQGDAVFLGRTTLDYARMWLGKAACEEWPKMVQLHSQPEAGDRPGSWTLSFAAFQDDLKLPIGPHGLPVKIRSIEPRLITPPDDALIGKSLTSDGALRGYVVASSQEMIVLSFSWKTLTKWGYKLGDSLTIEINGVARTGYIRRDTATEERAKEFTQRIPKHCELMEKLNEAKEAYEDAEWDSPDEKKFERKIAEIRKQLMAVKVPTALQSTLPLVFEELPHCDRRGVDLVALLPIYGAEHFLNAPLGSTVTFIMPAGKVAKKESKRNVSTKEGTAKKGSAKKSPKGK